MIGKETKIIIGESQKEITIKKLPIGKIIKLLNNIEKLPEPLVKLSTEDEAELIRSLPMQLALILPEVADIIVKAVDDEKLTKDYLLNECYFEDAVLIIETFLDVNNVQSIIARVKKIQVMEPAQEKRAEIAKLSK